jgi:hypothetical protein
MRVKINPRITQAGDQYMLVQIPHGREGASVRRVQSALSIQLSLGDPDRIVLMEGDHDSVPFFSGPPDLVAHAKAIPLDILARGTVWGPRDITL